MDKTERVHMIVMYITEMLLGDPYCDSIGKAEVEKCARDIEEHWDRSLQESNDVIRHLYWNISELIAKAAKDLPLRGAVHD